MEKSAVYRGAFAIGVGLFVASSAAGLVYQVTYQRSLPALLPSPFQYASSLLHQGELGDFVAEYRTAAAISPNVAWSHLQLAFALERAGDSPGALAEFLAAARLDPESGTAHYNVAVLLLRRGELKTARSHARQAERLARAAGERLDPRLLEALGMSGSED